MEKFNFFVELCFLTHQIDDYFEFYQMNVIHTFSLVLKNEY